MRKILQKNGVFTELLIFGYFNFKYNLKGTILGFSRATLVLNFSNYFKTTL